MLQLACRRLGVAPERALMVGDSRYDRDAARGAGTPFAGVGMPGDLTLDGLKDLLAFL
jgi:phosphoglycolate phosphatase-like HAD superfamily hydrolase